MKRYRFVSWFFNLSIPYRFVNWLWTRTTGAPLAGGAGFDFRRYRCDACQHEWVSEDVDNQCPLCHGPLR